MSARGRATHAPDVSRASDATVAGSARDEAAGRLLRGESVRDAARLSLVRDGASDGQDTGSDLPGDLDGAATGARRLLATVYHADARPEGAAPASPEAVADAAAAADAGGPLAAATPSPARPVTADGADGIAPPTTPAASGRHPSPQARPHMSRGEAPATDGAGPHRPLRSGGRRMPGLVVRGGEGMPGMGDADPAARMAARRRRSAADARRRRRAAARVARTPGTPTAASPLRLPAPARARAAGATATTAGLAPVALALVAGLVLTLLVATVVAGGAVDEDQRAGARLVARLATSEYEAGASRGDFNHKGQRYTSCTGDPDGGRTDWSASLVSWCLAEAGLVGAGQAPLCHDAATLLSWYAERPGLAEVHEWWAEPYEPVEGDLFVSWLSDGGMHAGIVTEAFANAFRTVEGDWSGGPHGTYDRDEEDGLGGYVTSRVRHPGEYSLTFVHPLYSLESARR